MRDDGRLLIKVQVSRDVLNRLERRQVGSVGAAAALLKNRNIIERAASRIYDAGRFERDGSLHVRTSDLI